MSFTENQLKRDVDLIKNILKTNGFYFASVKSSFTPLIFNISFDHFLELFANFTQYEI